MRRGVSSFAWCSRVWLRIIAFITFSAHIHKTLEHIGVEPDAPGIASACGSPLWDDGGA